MKFVLMIPYRDMGQTAPCLWTGALDAPDRETAWERVRALLGDATQVLDLLVGRDASEGWDELDALSGDDLLDAYGIAVGDPQLWTEDEFDALEPVTGVGM
ncbi:MAG TPA: hypothetical protein VFE30_10235 [Anaeromyxobacteraceae bacterium]|nr:hypothetical protein [Anaeromyxobacteraceae bacterium]